MPISKQNIDVMVKSGATFLLKTLTIFQKNMKKMEGKPYWYFPKGFVEGTLPSVGAPFKSTSKF